MKAPLIVLVLILLVVGVGWIKNVVKLSELDFESPYQAEVLRTIGIIPPIGAVFGYLTFEEEEK